MVNERAGLGHARFHRRTPCRMMNVGHEVKGIYGQSGIWSIAVFNPRQELSCAVPGDEWLLLGCELWADKRWDIQHRLVLEKGEKLEGSTSGPIAALPWL